MIYPSSLINIQLLFQDTIYENSPFVNWLQNIKSKSTLRAVLKVYLPKFSVNQAYGSSDISLLVKFLHFTYLSPPATLKIESWSPKSNPNLISS